MFGRLNKNLPDFNEEIKAEDHIRNWDEKLSLEPLISENIPEEQVKKFNEFWAQYNKRLSNIALSKFDDPDTSDKEKNKLLYFMKKLNDFEQNLVGFVRECSKQPKPQEYWNKNVKVLLEERNFLRTQVNNAFTKDTLSEELKMVAEIMLGVALIVLAVALIGPTFSTSLTLLIPATTILLSALRRSVKVADISSENSETTSEIFKELRGIEQEAKTEFDKTIGNIVDQTKNASDNHLITSENKDTVIEIMKKVPTKINFHIEDSEKDNSPGFNS